MSETSPPDLRGYTRLVVGDTLVYEGEPSFEAVMAMERELGSVTRIATRCAEVDFTAVIAVLYHCRKNPNETRETIGRQVIRLGLPSFIPVVTELMNFYLLGPAESQEGHREGKD